MISNIQALRAYAALAVVVYHTNFHIPGMPHTDFQGVAIFFVISGFIMTYITNKDSRESTPTSFFLHRLVRIVPLYWFCTILLVVLANLGTFNMPVTLPRLLNSLTHNPAELLEWLGSAFHTGTWVRIEEIVKSLLFIPYLNKNGDLHPVLGVGWTLNMEMYFYVCFSIMLFFGKIRAPIFYAIVHCGGVLSRAFACDLWLA